MRKGTVELFIFEQDAQGGVLRQMRRRLDLALNPQQYQLYLKSGVLFRENFEPRRGTATVRILAGDPASAAMGSLTIPVSLVK